MCRRVCVYAHVYTLCDCVSICTLCVCVCVYVHVRAHIHAHAFTQTFHIHRYVYGHVFKCDFLHTCMFVDIAYCSYHNLCCSITTHFFLPSPGRCGSTVSRWAREVLNSGWVSQATACLPSNHGKVLCNCCHQLQSLVGSGGGAAWPMPRGGRPLEQPVSLQASGHWTVLSCRGQWPTLH